MIRCEGYSRHGRAFTLWFR